MAFESIRGYVELASGLGDLTKARAKDAAHGLLSLPVAGITTGGKVALQAGSLADELLAAATANRSNLTALVRSEVDIAVSRLGLVSVQRLEEAEAEAARLRVEVARLRSTTPNSSARHSAAPDSASPKAGSAKSASPRTGSPRSASQRTTSAKSATPKSTAPKTTAKTAVATKSTAKKAVAPAVSSTSASPRKAATKSGRKAAVKASTKPTSASASRSAVSTRARPAGA